MLKTNDPGTSAATATRLNRPTYWPASPDLAKVAVAERVAMWFDREAHGCPDVDIGWAPSQYTKLANHASGVRIRLHGLTDRRVDRSELAVILGVSRELLDRAINDDFAGLWMRSRAELGAGRTRGQGTFGQGDGTVRTGLRFGMRGGM